MARRSTPQKKIDDAAFPVRVRIVVPGFGFGPELGGIAAFVRRGSMKFVRRPLLTTRDP